MNNEQRAILKKRKKQTAVIFWSFTVLSIFFAVNAIRMIGENPLGEAVDRIVSIIALSPFVYILIGHAKVISFQTHLEIFG